MKHRGILCPVFSLPGDCGIGDFGTAAYEFLNILHRTGFTVWQVLPLNPVGFGHSPYQPLSSFAGETVYIDLLSLKKDGLLDTVPAPMTEMPERVNYEAAAAFKKPYLEEAFRNFKKLLEMPEDYLSFRSEEWVAPYGVFTALREKNGGKPWMEWQEEDKTEKEISDLSAELKERAELEIFLQYEFRKQWLGILKTAHSFGIRLMGDIPIYVGGDSLDVYGDRDEFFLDPDGYPTSVAGVPPDYFSKTGQRWGNPIYDWEKMEKNGFSFWKKRLTAAAQLYDMIRIDHFLAFHAFWKIPATCETAVEGAWIPGPGERFFQEVLPVIPDTEIVAEDLGLIRPEVYALRDKYHFPGMNVLLFTLGDDGFRKKENMITYTGTHDNRTVLDQYDAYSDWERERFDRGLRAADITDAMGSKAMQAIRYAFLSGTDVVILNVGDVLEQREEGRINEPGTVSEKNWAYRLPDLRVLSEQCERIASLARETEDAEKKQADGPF